ncbi:MAG: UDP-N-acetylmuramate dehydrogenase [Thermodesulforhabdaceae bacterium]
MKSRLDQILRSASTTKSVLIRENEDLSKRTTFRIGGKAKLFIEPFDEIALGTLVKFFHDHHIPWKIIGAGSNVLVNDEGVEEPIVSLRSFKHDINVESETVTVAGKHSSRKIVVSVDAGMSLKQVLRLCARFGWGGCEFLTGIPATIGGAVFMNAGTSDGVMADIISQIELMTPSGEIFSTNVSAFSPGYRSLGIPEGHIVLKARLELVEETPERVFQRMRAIFLKRKSTQPITHPSAGCIFKNPPAPHPPAGWLIDQCGLKGCRIGDAQISPIHANWIVNLGNAKSREVRELINYAREKVLQKFGIRLEEEIKLW